MEDKLDTSRDIRELVKSYASIYSGINLAPNRLEELARVTGALVQAVDARAGRIAFGDDPHAFAPTLAALRGSGEQEA